jgi:general secretion pathway protein K
MTHAPVNKRRTRRKRPVDERGVALIMVLGAITVLTVFLTQLQEETSSELAAALAERDALKAEYYARSAVNLSTLLFATEPSITSKIRPLLGMVGVKIEQVPVWEFSDILLGPFNDAASTQGFLGTIGGDASLAKNLGIAGGGRFELTIIDESSKINVNTAPSFTDFAKQKLLAEQLLGLFAPVTNNPLFEGRDGDNQFSDRQTICGAIADWVDSDSSGNEKVFDCNPLNSGPSSGAAEDSFYQTIGLHYQRKNAPFDSLEELRLVRGMGDDFWATFVDPDPDDPKKRLMTVWGTDKINVGSANAQTLLALVCGSAPPDTELCNDAAQMSSFIMAITLVKSFVPIPIFGSGQDFLDAMAGKGLVGPMLAQFGVKPVTFKNPKDIAKALSGRTRMFSIYAVGVVPGYKRTTKVKIHAVIDRLGAPKLTAAGGTTGMPGSPGTPGSGAASTAGANIAAAAAAAAAMTPPSAMPGATNPSPGGTIVYWRVE